VGNTSLFENAVQIHRAGQADRAEPLYRRVIAQEPQNGEALFLLGTILQASEQLAEACSLLERAVRIAPSNAAFLSSLGGVYRRLGKTREALGVLLKAIAHEPDFAEAILNLALTFDERGEQAAAGECYERVREVEPTLSPAIARLTSVKAGQRELLTEAPAERVPEPDMNPAELFMGLGVTLRSRGAVDHAAAWYRAALKLNPQSAYALTALGAIHAEAGRLDEAIVNFQHALEINPHFHSARGYLDMALEQTGRHDETAAVHQAAIALRPEDPNAHSVRLFNMQFLPNVSASDILAEARAWNDRHARPLASRALPLKNDRSPERRLRVGYVSPDFKEHAMSRFTIPLLRHHDHQQFEIYCYSSAAEHSEETAIIRRASDVWREVGNLDDAALSVIIRRDKIDILVDLTMHLLGSRLLAFARRPAPIQICWLAYPGTTGLDAMDYRLSDPYLDPPGSNTDVYSEQTLRLPDSFWCYDPLTAVPEVSALPALEAGHITFGSLNHFRKVNDGVLRLWARVLNAVPASRLVLVAPEGGARDRVLMFFEAAGIKRDRIEFVGRCERLDYLARYQHIDIGLETLPYNGQTTSLDALWMGVPTVTLVGDTVVGRAGLCQSMNLGLPELVATTEDDYVGAAVSLASDLAHLSQLRQTLRARLQQSPLMDAPRFARNLESLYRDVWRRWCEKSAS